MRKTLVACAAAAALLGWATQGSAAGCDRSCLIASANKALGALAAHDLKALALAPDARMTVNGETADLSDAKIAGIDGFAFRQYATDPQTDHVAVFGVAEEKGRRGTFFMRLKLSGGQPKEVEIVAGPRTDDGVPGLISPNPLFDLPLPPASRRSRAQLIAVADSYFEGLERHDGGKVPISADCRRFEDGVQTSLNPVSIPGACNAFAPFTYMDKTAGRAYPIVDVERGLVLGQMVIQVSTPRAAPNGAVAGGADARRPVNPISGMVMPPNPFRTQPRYTVIQELFKIIDGKITEIQTVRLDRPYGSGDGWRVKTAAAAR